MHNLQESTIAAISTPMAGGGLGVLRISGHSAIEVAAHIFAPLTPGKTLQAAKGYTALLGRVQDEKGVFDQAVALVFRAPKSFTGEDVVELSCHGGIYIMKRLLRAALDAGAALADRGEFTKRAFLNGKLSLTQAEAVADLIGAQGDMAARAALCRHEGALAAQLKQYIKTLTEQSAHLSAWIDFPEEGIEEVETGRLLSSLCGVKKGLEALLSGFDRGELLRSGIMTVILGKPNAGKSTLMNLLAGQQRSIVTDIPGTTRDVIENQVLMGDIVLNLADTAGVRKTEDPVEQAGVGLALKRAQEADLILAVFDSSQPLSQEDRELAEKIQGRRVIAVVNKTDLAAQLNEAWVRDRFEKMVYLSAKNGEGLAHLQKAIEEALELDEMDLSAPLLAGERQRLCAQNALECVGEACVALKSGMTLDAVNVDIDCAIDSLLELTGEKASDLVIEEVFATFCVGK